MTFKFEAKLKVDGSQARAELRNTAAESDRLGQSVQAMGDKGQSADADFARLRAELKQYKADLTQLTAEHARATTQIDALQNEIDQLRVKGGKLPNTYNGAAGSVGNLTAQFNDIGVMLAAGQNPLTLAIQQGTQITQVIGPMGAAGAAKALGRALVSMVSPVNLITIGSIAAGAAMIQWLTRSEDSAEGLESELEAVNERLQDAERYIRAFETGAMSSERLTLFDQIREAQEKLAKAENDTALQGSSDRKRNAERRLKAAQDQVKAARDLLAQYDAQIAKEDRIKSIRAQADEAAKRYLETRRQSAVAADEILSSLTRENELLALTLVHGEDSRQVQDAMVAVQREDLEAKLATLKVAEELKDEIRQAFERGAALAALDMASGISTAADEAARLARNLNTARSSSRVKAQKAQNRLDTVGDPIARAGGNAVIDFREGFDDGGYGLLASGNAAALAQGETLVRQEAENAERLAIAANEADAEYRKLNQTVASGGAGKQGESDAVRDLIEGYRLELAILQESDPLRQDMLRHREVLAQATEAERIEVERLIGKIQEETAERERASATSSYLNSTMSDLLPSLAKGGDDAASAWARFSSVLEDILWQAVLLGEGPLMDLLGLGGGSGSGGGIVGFITGLFGFRDGGDPWGQTGMQYGFAGPRDDRKPILVSAGEFVMNARATSAYRAQLEAMNAGASIPAFANGGAVAGPASFAAMPFVLKSQIVNESGLRVREEQEVQPDGSRLQRLVLSEAVDGAMTAPGGAAKRRLAQLGLQAPRPIR